MPEICVVHLAWKPLGLQPLRDFVASYQRHGGGIKHQLVVAFNGFADDRELDEYHQALSGVEYDWFRIFPSTQDIPVYFEAASRLECEYLCFLNSYSVLLDEDWLAKLHRHAQRPDVGLVGATGSWHSLYSGAQLKAGRPSAYAATRQENEARSSSTRPRFFALSPALRAQLQASPWPVRFARSAYYYGLVAPFYLTRNSARHYLQRRKDLRRFSAAHFDPFPAAHLRTNAFMIRRKVMLDLKTGKLDTKDLAYRFENGRNSMTNQVLRMGLRVLVVGKDGVGYTPEEWPVSETFWQGDQNNLLIADNNTENYASADAATRSFLSRTAWGAQAAPADTAARIQR